MWARLKEMTLSGFAVLREAFERFGDDRGGRMAAAVAYRAMFALAPLLLIAVYVLGLFFGDDLEAREELSLAIARVAGSTVAEAVDDFLRATGQTGDAAGVVGFALLLWTGSSLFLELQQNLNDIFGMPPRRLPGLLRAARQRAIGFVWSLALGVVLLAVWLLNASWRFLGELMPPSFEPAHRLITFLAPLVSALVLPPVFGLSFQTLSRVPVSWRAIWRGSLFTTVAFLAAAYGAGIYFGLGGRHPARIAGSIFVVLLLAYVLSAVFLFGAEVTKVLEERYQRRHLGAAEGQTPGVVATPPPPVPSVTVVAFLVGLLIGRRRRR